MEETITKISELCGGLDDADKNIIRAYLELKEENKELKEKLKSEELQKIGFRGAVDKNAEIISELREENRLHEKELEYLRKRCKELEYILEHEYNRIVPGGML